MVANRSDSSLSTMVYPQHLVTRRLLLMGRALMLVVASWVTSGSIAQANDVQTLTWPDGTRYVGSVRSNQMHGQGTIYWQDGTRYVGNFENHERQGAGMIILPDGTTYEGEFDRGVLIREALDQNSAPGDGTPTDKAPVELSDAATNQIRDRLDFWAAAWMAQNPDQYLSVYSSDFRLAPNESRPAWEMNRRERLLTPQYIQLDIRFDRFTPQSNGEVEVQIRQAYKSDTYREISNKILVMKAAGDNWTIIEEREP